MPMEVFYQLTINVTETFRLKYLNIQKKVSLNDAYDLNDAPRNLFVKYLADLKVTEALARAKSNNTKADSINNWFIQFEKLLQQIFEDTTLKLDF